MKKFFYILFAFLSFSANAQEKKVALIIGNGKYSEYFTPLRTPVNDAKAIDWTLTALGYETIVGTDSDGKQMSQLLKDFKEKARMADVALFYYSGHGGYTMKGKYFLVPSGKYQNSATLAADCYDFESVERTMEATGAKLKLLFIDACRCSLDGMKGWMSYDPAQMVDKKGGARGTAYFFGTSETAVSFVGDGDFSVFTEALLNHLGDSGYFNDVWNAITKEVVSRYPEQRPKSKPTDFEDFQFNPSNYHIYGRVKYGDGLVNIKVRPDSVDVKIKIRQSTDKKQSDWRIFGNDANLSLPFGVKHDIQIAADGYETYENSISIFPSPKSQKSFIYNLTELKPVTLTVTSNVSGASVCLDGKFAGKTNCKLSTMSGTHQLKVEKNGYKNKTVTVNLRKDSNQEHFILERSQDRFLGWSGSYSGLHHLSYHFSPKYQIGLSYLYRPEDSHFSYGLYLSGSTGLLKGIVSAQNIIQDVSINVSSNRTYSVYENGVLVEYKETQSAISDNLIDEYSEEIDPDHDAKKYDSNAIMLANFGYNPCNGLLIEAGIGAGYHQDKYYLPYALNMTKTVTTNLNTGQVVGEPKYDYKKSEGEQWFRQGTKWSPALRLGGKAFIPLDGWDRYFISIGGGYTFLFTNNKYSSWDASVGFMMYFY